MDSVRPVRRCAGARRSSSGRSLSRIARMAASTSYSTRTNSTLDRAPPDVQHDVPRPPVAVLRPPDAAGIDEVDAADLAVPGLVGVAERDHVARLHPGVARHLEAELVRPVLGPVQVLSVGVAVDQHDPRSREVAAVRQQVDAERQAAEVRLGPRLTRAAGSSRSSGATAPPGAGPRSGSRSACSRSRPSSRSCPRPRRSPGSRRGSTVSSGHGRIADQVAQVVTAPMSARRAMSA